jgi:hypothetical protein
MPTPEELRKSHRKRVFGAARNAQAFSSVFDGPDGDYVLHHICKKFHVFDTIVEKNRDGSVDIHKTLRNEGQRMAAIDMLKAAKRDTVWIEQQIEKAINEPLDE